MGGMVYSDSLFFSQSLLYHAFNNHRFKVRLKCCLILSRHQAREAEPKDYDIKDYQPQKRNLHNSTYHRIGNVTDGVRRTYNFMLN